MKDFVDIYKDYEEMDYEEMGVAVSCLLCPVNSVLSCFIGA